MVGVRGLLGQFPAVALYRWTGDLRVPLLLAVVLFAWGSVIMFRVERDRQAGLAVVEEAVPLAPPSA
jgi:hypothetical protein